MKNFLNNNRLLKNDTVLQVGTGKNTTIPLYRETKKIKTKKKKKCHNNKKEQLLFKGYATTYNVKILNSFNP